MKETFINTFLRHFFKVSFVLLIFGLFFYIMLPFMLALIFGGIIAMALNGFLGFFMRKGLTRNLSLFVLSFMLGFLGFVPFAAFLIRGSRMIGDLLGNINVSEMTARFISPIRNLSDRINDIYGLDQTFIEAKLISFITKFGTYLSSEFNTFLAELPFMFMMGLIILLSVYFFLKESEKIRDLFDRYFNFTKKNGDHFVNMLEVCCREVFFSNILTGLIQALIVSIGALIFNIGDFYIVFFSTFVLSFIPVVGAAPVAAILGLLCYMETRIGAGTGMMVVALISGTADNICRSYFGTLGEVSVHPMIGLLAVIGGVIMFGFLGLFIGPLVVTIIFGAIPIIINEYFPSTK